MEELLQTLSLHSLNDNYVNRLWSDAYSCDESDVSDEYRSHLETIPLKDTLTNLGNEILSRVYNGNFGNWRMLVEAQFDLKRTLAVIHHLLSSAIESEDTESLKYAFASITLYLSLLAVPDCHVYSVFQSCLFVKASKLMTLPVLRRQTSSPQSRRRGRFSSINVNISSHEERSLMTSVSYTLKILLKALRLGNFCQSHGAVELVAELLSNLAQHETSQNLLSQCRPGETPKHGRNLSLDAFYGLLYLCSPQHGDIREVARIVSKYIFDLIQNTFQKDFSSKEGNIIRQNAFNFVYQLIEQVGSNAHQAVLVLFQFLCLHCPERAEPRYKLVDNIFFLLMKFNDELFVRTVCLFIDLSYNDKSVALRHFTLAMIGKLLLIANDQVVVRTERFIAYNNSATFPSHLHKILFLALMSRIQDISALVTAKALTIFSDYLDSRGRNNNLIDENLNALFVGPYQNVKMASQVPCKPSLNIYDLSETFKKTYCIDPTVMPCGRSIMFELLDCETHDKVLVRKAALQCIIRIFRLNEKFISEETLKIITCHSRDSGVVVRKMMAEEFTDLLLCHPSHVQLAKEWCCNILPLIVDPEPKVVDKVLENIARAVLENMSDESLTSSARKCLPWVIMSFIAEFQLKKFFLQACSKWDNNILKPRKLVPILKSHIGVGKVYNTPAWTMLTCITEFISIDDPLFILEFYRSEVHNVPNVSTNLSCLVMEALWFCYKSLSSEEKKCLEEELNMDLSLFKVPVPLISRAMDIRHGLYIKRKNLPNDSKTLSVLPQWAVDLIKKCEEGITDMLRANKELLQDEEVMLRFVITLGNAVLFCPGVVHSSTIQQLQFMLMPSTVAHESYWTGTCSSEMKAGLITTLGKLSLQNEERAHELVKSLGPLLKGTDESVLKNNIIVCLSDLCVRYASLVEGLLPEMCVCLKDCQRSVRENTLVLLIQLLQADYLKMREKLIFNLLTMLNDVDSIIRAMTRTFFIDTVFRKNKKFFCSNFTRAVFYYNGYKTHHQFSRIVQTQQEEKAFNLSGSKHTDLRYEIYRFVLSHSEEETRMIISQLLCIDICKGVLENIIPLDETGQDVLKDALFVMSCEEMRHSEKKDADDDARLDVEDMENQLNTAHKEVLSQMRRKHIIEAEVPILAALYGKLSSALHPLTKDVLKNLKLSVHEEKLDLNDILKGEGKQILKELRSARRESYRSDSSSVSEESDLL